MQERSGGSEESRSTVAVSEESKVAVSEESRSAMTIKRNPGSRSAVAVWSNSAAQWWFMRNPGV